MPAKSMLRNRMMICGFMLTSDNIKRTGRQGKGKPKSPGSPPSSGCP
jgi:hypothetical protein